MNPTGRMRWLGVAISFALAIAVSLQGFSVTGYAKKKKHNGRGGPRVLWRDPGNIRNRDLYYGPGSRDLAPKPPFRFLKEDLEGGMPKFDVKDAA